LNSGPLALNFGVCDYGFMPKRISKKKQEPDANEIAFRVVSSATAATPSQPIPAITVSQIMAEMGRKGGKIGGKKRLETMSAKERSERAKQAAKARWKKKRRNA
jgi:hypothetical protein